MRIVGKKAIPAGTNGEFNIRTSQGLASQIRACLEGKRSGRTLPAVESAQQACRDGIDRFVHKAAQYRAEAEVLNQEVQRWTGPWDPVAVPGSPAEGCACLGLYSLFKARRHENKVATLEALKQRVDECVSLLEPRDAARPAIVARP
jgi:hypothetical protein